MSFAIDPDLADPVAAWSFSTALGVILFAVFFPRPARRERAPAGAERAGADVADSPAITTVALPIAVLGARPVAADGKAGVTSGPTNPGEATLPRWLRPTLQAQRQLGERGVPRVSRPPARFDASRALGVERRTITYRLVRLSSGPDELASDEVGRLDRGDEVEVIGEHESFLQVRTPSGAEGWVPRVVILG